MMLALFLLRIISSRFLFGEKKMNEILIFLDTLEKNIDNFFDFSKGKMPLRVGKYYLFCLLLLSASAIFL